jgi:hypothetical protein
MSRTERVPTYCYQCVAGPDLLKVVVRDGVAVGVEPNCDMADTHPAGGKVCVRALRDGSAGRIAAGLGGALSLVALALALASPATAGPAVVLAGFCMLAGQIQVKSELIVRAGFLRPITVTGLRMSRRLP